MQKNAGAAASAEKAAHRNGAMGANGVGEI
jgi:hypothetical protein